MFRIEKTPRHYSSPSLRMFFKFNEKPAINFRPEMHEKVIVILAVLFVLMGKAEFTNHTANVKCAELFKCSITNGVSMTCDTLQLITIPKCTENIEKLIIRSGVIERLYNFDFPQALNTLEILAVKNVYLKKIDKMTFENLKNLVDLDLSENFLRTIDPELLINNVHLERLNFSSNMIRKLVANQFPLPNLKTLDLSNCNLELVDEMAFSNTTALQWLNLRTNKLKTLSFQVSVHVVDGFLFRIHRVGITL